MENQHPCAVESSPSRLLCYNNETSHVFQLDCSTAPARLLQKIPIEYDGKKPVSFTCASCDFLLVTRGYEGVFAYALGGGECKWRVSGNLPGMDWEMTAAGVTADDQGHLFVCDINNKCVHMLSVQDGAYLVWL